MEQFIVGNEANHWKKVIAGKLPVNFFFEWGGGGGGKIFFFSFVGEGNYKKKEFF